MTDRQLHVLARFDERQRAHLRTLISDDLIEEHRARPLGQHSDALERVLQYFRRRPAAGKHVAVITRPWEEYRIGVLSGVPGGRVTILADEPAYPTEEAALHAIFLLRVRDLMEG